MMTAIESRLWLAVHLLYPNSSQAFDVYQAIILQCEAGIEKEDRVFIFSSLVSVFDKITPITLNLSFYEFEFDQIDQWKVIYKSSQKTQLIIFIGVLIFDLKINEIAPLVKLTKEKTQFVFHQMFKKFSQEGAQLKLSEPLNFKKQNDLKISYLFTYENLIEYCLDQLSPEEALKVEKGLEFYPVLLRAKDEYLKIISQIQNLKVQRAYSFLTKGKTKHKVYLAAAPSEIPTEKLTKRSDTNDSNDYYKKLKAKIPKNSAIGFGIFLTTMLVVFQFNAIRNLFIDSEKTIVIQQIEKKPIELVASRPNVTPPESLPKVAEPPPKPPAISKGGLYRGFLVVDDLAEANKKVLSKVIALGAKKAGEVELGWLKTKNMAYYHFTMPEENIETANEFFKQIGRLDIKFETHPRLIPAGIKRFIIEVKSSQASPVQ